MKSLSTLLILSSLLLAACGGTRPADTETAAGDLVVSIDTSSWFEQTFVVSPDSRRVAYAAHMGEKVFVVVEVSGMGVLLVRELSPAIIVSSCTS